MGITRVTDIAILAAEHLLVPYQDFDANPGEMLPIEYGESAHVIDVDGRRYLAIAQQVRKPPRHRSGACSCDPLATST